MNITKRFLTFAFAGMIAMTTAGVTALASMADQTAGQDMKKAGHDVKDATIKTGHATKKTTKKVVHKSAKTVKKGAAKVEDKTKKD